MLAAIRKRQRELCRFLHVAAVQLSSQYEEMTAALLQFAGDELGRPSSSPSDVAALAGRPQDRSVVLFDAVGRLERLAEAAARYTRLHPALARGNGTARLAKVAGLQMAILARYLCDIDPRLAALSTDGAAGRVAL